MPTIADHEMPMHKCVGSTFPSHQTMYAANPIQFAIQKPKTNQKNAMALHRNAQPLCGSEIQHVFGIGPHQIWHTVTIQSACIRESRNRQTHDHSFAEMNRKFMLSLHNQRRPKTAWGIAGRQNQTPGLVNTNNYFSIVRDRQITAMRI